MLRNIFYVAYIYFTNFWNRYVDDIGTGCPPDRAVWQKVLFKAVSGDGCRGCNSCEPEEGETEGESEGEVNVETPPRALSVNPADFMVESSAGKEI